MKISGYQCRAARALLGINQLELAAMAGVAKQTLADFERGARTPYARTLDDVVNALEKAGIQFLPAGDDHGEGVRFRDPG
ncbi:MULTISPECIES: helix-turn-helix domain-containing protein [Oceanibaculum]|uniref:Helix-turn-helix domain-containing protein n=1 Tax=Oceanibaculum indicum P24 TaxID=1207063 RepID=K2JPV1_9PROT|nr:MULTISPECIES: helix-turn-helix transcriptional regulator [Oceanibaculum]EKE76552.1 helix-turn-helix domain-containing protein [Oceanibaculum indicum P24]